MPGLGEFSQSDFRRGAIRGANLVKARRGSCPAAPFCHPLSRGYGSRLNPINPRASERLREREEEESRVNRGPSAVFTITLRSLRVGEGVANDRRLRGRPTRLRFAHESRSGDAQRGSPSYIRVHLLPLSCSSLPPPSFGPNNMLFRESCSV